VAIYNLDGKEAIQYHKTAKLYSLSNSASQCFVIPFNSNKKNISSNKYVFASSTTLGSPSLVTDGNYMTRWSSKSADDEWIAIDLGKSEIVNSVVLNWEDAAAKRYKIHVSDDKINWTTVFYEDKGRPGLICIDFEDQKARYVRVLGLERLTWYGYSLWEFEVYGGDAENKNLSSVHFIRLKLWDESKNLISENFYWSGNDVLLKNTVKITKENDKLRLKIIVKNPSESIAFATWVQLRNSKTKERILPVFLSDNYFTLLPKETKEITAEFDANLLNHGENVVVELEPYNNLYN
jgi:hypothetical protein